MVVYKCDECGKVLEEHAQTISVGAGSLMSGIILCDDCGKDVVVALKDKKCIHKDGWKYKGLKECVERLASTKSKNLKKL